jgi:hypothetical protein
VTCPGAAGWGEARRSTVTILYRLFHPSPSPPPHLSLRIDIQIDVRSVRAHSRENGTCFSLRWFSHALAAKAQHGRFLLTCLLAFKRFKGRLRDSRRYPEIQDWRFLK